MDNHPLWADENIVESEVSSMPETPSKTQMRAFASEISSNCALDRAPIFVTKNGTRSDTGVYGFTLSYLRRVPELQALARKVIDADEKRKRREERKAKEAATPKGSQTTRKAQKEPEKKYSRHEKTKRLFRHAILRLCDEGSIVIWDGPKGDWQPGGNRDTSRFWEMDSTIPPSWVGNTQSVSCTQINEDDELSDPPSGEESYVSLTPVYLGKYVENAIKDIMATSLASECNPTSLPKGPTKKEILVCLQGDGRWRRVSDWAVDEAVDWLKKEERVWDVGEGRWELTI
jgi:hypothetical protein